MGYPTDVIKNWILTRLERHEPNVSFTPEAILSAVSRSDVDDVACVASVQEALLSLIWEGKLVVTGPWRVRLPAPHEVKVKPPELVRIEEAREKVVEEALIWRAKEVNAPTLRRAVDEFVAAEDAVKGKNG